MVGNMSKQRIRSPVSNVQQRDDALSSVYVFGIFCVFFVLPATNNSLWSLQKLMDEVPLGDKVPRKK